MLGAAPKERGLMITSKLNTTALQTQSENRFSLRIDLRQMLLLPPIQRTHRLLARASVRG